MHYNRRKKKRVNYGVRAVELIRGSKGFGFTISGQQPCILSCIVAGSPAEVAGLRAGDYLVAVNGHNVGKAPHDDVVRLIGHSKGILRLQIAENYYSDSSDEEGQAAARSKPKYSHKARSNASVQCRVAKVVHDLQTGAMFDSHIEAERAVLPPSKMQCSQNGLCHRWNMSSGLPVPPPPPLSLKRETEKIVHRTVVGYLGTIDIPNQLHPSTMMQVLRKCIKRLKAEKRNPTTVLLTIHVANIKLTNSENKIIAEYPSYRIVFCNSFSDQDKQCFGIVTKSAKDSDDIVSNSCHVFTIYYKLIDHSVHLGTCNVFGFTCTKTSELNVCQEFPDSCNSLIGAIQTLYISDSGDAEQANLAFGENRRHRDAVSPQPSNMSSSTAHSSNSDSGIGFKDEYGSQSDRNVLQYPMLLGPRIRNGADNDAVASRLTVRATNDVWDKDSRCESPRKALSSDAERFLGVETEGRKAFGMENESAECSGDAITCPRPSARTAVQLVESVGTSSFSRTIAGMIEPPEAIRDFEPSAAAEQDLCNKLSPKVFGVSKSLGHSLEDVKVDEEEDLRSFSGFCNGKSDVRPWGSLQEIRKIGGFESDSLLYGSTESCDKNDASFGVHTWAMGFEKLLTDPMGLQTFAEFLKKEFSHENIYFWAACERYKDTQDIVERHKLAWQIYQRHLSTAAAEPVNVDSHAAGQITQELLNQAPATLFLQAQKQVFNLMKFDSYPRFLRSDLYRHCLETGSGIVSTEDCDLALTGSLNVKLKKSHSDAEDRCRKSILPWHRKNRSKSKDRGESEYNKTPSRSETIYKSFTSIKRDSESNNNDDNISISSSRSSLASWDLALRQSFSKHSVASYEGHNEKKDAHAKCTGLCRVILPDGSTTVVPTSQSECIKDVVTRLLDKRALRYSNYDVVVLATDELVGLKYPSSVLAGQEVEVVPAKALKVDLPSRRIITVVAHKGRTLKDVLRPLLNKYGFKLELITIWGEGHPISLDIPAVNAPSRLVLTSNNEDIQRDALRYHDEVPQGQSTLDEITNKVFEELLVGKSANKYYSEGSCKSDDQRSEGSSILSSKFFMRDSSSKKKIKSKSSNMSEKSNSTDCTGEESSTQSNRPHAPLIAKWRNGVKLQLPGRFDGDELYEGLKRAQRARLEDQRGTEINFELPDFLKDKENGKLTDDKKMRRARLTASANVEGALKFYDLPIINREFKDCSCQSNSDDCERVLKPPETNKELDLSSSLDLTLEDADQTIIENDNGGFKTKSRESSPSKLLKPPPLPPKPKGLALTNIVKPSHILSTKPAPRSAQITSESRDTKNIF